MSVGSRVRVQMWRRRSAAGPAGSSLGARMTVAALNSRGASGDKDKVRRRRARGWCVMNDAGVGVA